jgi:SAM-dependent methyltransferase
VSARRPGARTKIALAGLGRAGDAGALAFYEDAAYYTKTYARRGDDVAYYVRQAQIFGGPVLEYGIGNGRIAIPIARAGFDVVGVDLSKPMLTNLEERLRAEPAEVRKRVRARHGDMCSVKLRRRFPLVIAPFNAILHLYRRSEIEAFLQRVRAHLAPGGRFIFDYSTPQAADLCRDPRRRYHAPRLRHPATGEVVRYAERFEYDPLRQLLLVRVEFIPKRGASWTVPLTHRQFFPLELSALLHYSGFENAVWSADFRDLPPDRDTDSLVVSCGLGGVEPRSRGKGSRRTGPRLAAGPEDA